MRAERLDKLEEYIINNKTVSLEILADKFKISKTTLRRDIETLLEHGLIKKVYGGVVAVQKNSENPKILTPFAERSNKNKNEKRLIAKKATEFINEGDIIFVDTGSSTVDIIDFLSAFNNLTIITNSVVILYKCLDFPNLNLIGLPGVLKTNTASLVGIDACTYLSRFNIDKAFMACTAIDMNGVSNATVEEAEIKKTALSRSRECYILIDHTKFQKTSLITYCPLADIDHIITDRAPGDEFGLAFAKNHVKVHLADTLISAATLDDD